MTRMLKSISAEILSQDELKHLSSAFDVIGDIAVLKLPLEWPYTKKSKVAMLLMQKVKSIKSVWNQVGPVEGEYRIRRLEYLAGEKRSDTIYREHGCSFHVDLQSVYFSPRLSSERLRIASLTEKGEKIFNMFSGVGTFSVVIAKKVAEVEVYSSEINEKAYSLMELNIRSNKLIGKVIPLRGDCREHAGKIPKCDRVLMPLPERAYEFLGYAIKAARHGAVIHYYEWVKGAGKEAIEASWEHIRKNFDCFKLQEARVVSEVAPRTSEVVLDLSYSP
ncbi:MAG: class I SAM-dependent methyltransferase family protein [Nitrososphaerota archaeon]